jgi:hypothetical protein
MSCRYQLRYPAFGYFLQGAGWALIVFSLLVDMFYPGSPGFGSLQYAGMVVGVMLILTGLRELLLPQSVFWVRLLFLIYLLGIAVTGLTPQPYRVDETRSLWGGDFSGADFFINVSGFIPFGYLLLSCLGKRDGSPEAGSGRRVADWCWRWGCPPVFSSSSVNTALFPAVSPRSSTGWPMGLEPSSGFCCLSWHDSGMRGSREPPATRRGDTEGVINSAVRYQELSQSRVHAVI